MQKQLSLNEMVIGDTYIGPFLLFWARYAVPVSSHDEYSGGDVSFLGRWWRGVSNDWSDPEIDEFQICEVRLSST